MIDLPSSLTTVREDATMRHLRRALLTVAAMITAVLAVPAAQTAAAADLRFSAIDPHWADPGPFDVAVDVGLTATFYRPAELGDHGGKSPVIVWGNGTGATPAAYDGLLRHWASYGFIVAAANTPL